MKTCIYNIECTDTSLTQKFSNFSSCFESGNLFYWCFLGSFCNCIYYCHTTLCTSNRTIHCKSIFGTLFYIFIFFKWVKPVGKFPSILSTHSNTCNWSNKSSSFIKKTIATTSIATTSFFFLLLLIPFALPSFISFCF